MMNLKNKSIKMHFIDLFCFLYVLVSLGPVFAVFLINTGAKFESFFIFIISFVISYLYTACLCKFKTARETMICDKIEIAEPKYTPVYIAYFIVALNIYDLPLFMALFVMIYLLILKSKISFLNPYILFFGYKFYEVTISNDTDYAKYRVYLITKEDLKTQKHIDGLIRINNFTFLQKEVE